MAAVAVINNPAVDAVVAPSQAEKKFKGATIVVANPIYDGVFKYMVYDRSIAKLVISTLLDEDIVDLRPNPQERPRENLKLKDTGLSFHRLDYSANIKTINGQTSTLMVEMQKKIDTEAIKRFKRYIAEQYNYAGDEDRDEDISRIYNIFFWGGRIVRNDCPIIETPSQSRYRTKGKNYKKLNNNRINNLLHHHSLDIQIKNLEKQPPQNEAEELLAVFDQKYCTENKHYLEIPLDDVPEKFHTVLFRLQKAGVDPNVRRQMTAQDQFDKFIEKQRAKDRAEGEKKGEAKRKKLEAQIAQTTQNLAQTTQELENERKKNQELAERLKILENINPIKK